VDINVTINNYWFNLERSDGNL